MDATQAFLHDGSFTPHLITVNAREDVAMKVMSISQQEGQAICVLAASGSISNVTLHQPTTSGGTMTYEGHFEILSLTGSFTPTVNGVVRSRSGGISVALAGPDGRVFGGGLAGVLIAADPVQVVIGSFLPRQQHDPRPKNTIMEPVPAPFPTLVLRLSRELTGGGCGVQRLDLSSPPTSHTEPLLLAGRESNDDSPSKGDVSG